MPVAADLEYHPCPSRPTSNPDAVETMHSHRGGSATEITRYDGRAAATDRRDERSVVGDTNPGTPEPDDP